MANLFDSANYPTREPASLQIGDLWAWKRTDLVTDYPSSAYSLSYVLRREITGERIAISTTGSTTAYTVEVVSNTTDDYEPGRYHWVAYITRTSRLIAAFLTFRRIEVQILLIRARSHRSRSTTSRPILKTRPTLQPRPTQLRVVRFRAGIAPIFTSSASG